MRVLIVYNEPVLPKDHPEADSEHEIVWVTEKLGEILGAAGMEVAPFGIDHRPDGLIARLREDPPDVVVNLFEQSVGHPAGEDWVAGTLEWLGVPFTGSGSETLCIARNKHLAKGLLRAAGLPTPDFYLAEEVPARAGLLAWPVIVKPCSQEASIGIDQGSVVTDQAALDARAGEILARYGGPVLIEAFIRGRELSVSVIADPAPRALPPVEILFIDPDPNFWPILSYEGKWKPDTREYDSTPPKYGADVDPVLGAELAAIACRAFTLLGCRDYARVDFRVTEDGQPMVLEVNPNPDISPNAFLSGCLQSGGMTHAQYVIDLVRGAHARAKPDG